MPVEPADAANERCELTVLYSITSSARARIANGIVRPSVAQGTPQSVTPW